MKHIHFIRRILKNEEGATAVEFGIVSLLFLMLVFGIIDGGRVFWVWNSMEYAIEQTTRYAVVNKEATDDELQSFAVAAMGNVNPNTDNFVVTISRSFLGDIENIQIDGDYNFSALTPFMPASWDNIALSVTSTARMRAPPASP